MGGAPPKCRCYASEEANDLCLVFSSSDMDPEKLNSEGMRLLRQFVQYMEQGGTTLGDVLAQKPVLNPFEMDVRDTLASRGLHLNPQYGEHSGRGRSWSHPRRSFAGTGIWSGGSGPKNASPAAVGHRSPMR
jgi:hypothetical protein